MIKLTGKEWGFVALLILFSSIPVLGGLVRIGELVAGLSLMPANPRAIDSPFPIVVHIIGSIIFCVFGAFQFMPSLRISSPKLHRALGYFAIFAGVSAAISGLWMTLFFDFPEALQGSLLFVTRISLGLAMVGLILFGLYSIKRQAYVKHSVAMIRAYAIGQGASTQALLGIAVIVLIGVEPTGIFRDIFMLFCWAINLIVAEVFIRRMKGTAKLKKAGNSRPNSYLSTFSFRISKEDPTL